MKSGDRIGPYCVVETLGRGGMGIVLRARHEATGAEHAVKLILHAAKGTHADRRVARFRREAQVLAKVAPAHRAIVRIHGFGADAAGRPWFSMDLVEGESLADRLRRGPLPFRDAATLIAELADAVDAVHRLGVVHRDIKPSNVLVDADGRPRLVDFGTCWADDAQRLTQTGQTIGTLASMAPEQIRPDPATPVGPAADVYALGATLFEAISGAPPFAGDTARLVMAILADPVPTARARDPSVPEALDAICRRALAKRPSERPASAAQLADELRAWRESGPSGPLAGARSRTPTVAAGLLLAAALGVGGVALATTLGARGERAVSPAARIAELDQLQDRLARSSLTPSSTTRLRELAEGSELARPDALRARILHRTVSLCLSRDDAAAALEEELAELLRQAAADEALLEAAGVALARSRRPGSVHAVFLGPAPALPVAHPEMIAAVATTLGADPALPTPSDEALLAALWSAPMPEEAARATLIARLGEVFDGDDAAETAVSVISDALADDIFPDASRMAAPLADALQAACVADILGERDRQARALLRVLLRVPERHLAPPGFEDAVKLRRALEVAQNGDRPGSVARALLIASLLERHALSPLDRAQIRRDWRELHRDQLIDAGDAEARVPPDRRDPLVLIVVARVISGPNAALRAAQADRCERYADAALATEVEGRWVDLPIAFELDTKRLYRADQRDAARLRRLRRAYEADRARPIEERWPAVAERYADAINDLWPGDPDEALAEVTRVVLDAADVQLAAADRVQAYLALDLEPPWPLDRVEPLLDEFEDTATRFLALGAPACCERAAALGTAAPDTLLERGIELAHRFSVFDSDAQTLWDLLGNHHHAHGRIEAALRARLAGVRDQQTSARRAGKAKRADRLWTVVERLSRHAERFEEVALPGDALTIADDAIALAERVLGWTERPDPARGLEIARIELQRARTLRSLERTADADAARAQALETAASLGGGVRAPVRQAIDRARAGDLLEARKLLDALPETPPETPQEDESPEAGRIEGLTARAFIAALEGDFETGERVLKEARALRAAATAAKEHDR